MWVSQTQIRTCILQEVTVRELQMIKFAMIIFLAGHWVNFYFAWYFSQRWHSDVRLGAFSTLLPDWTTSIRTPGYAQFKAIHPFPTTWLFYSKVWEMEDMLPLYRRYGSPIAVNYLLCIYKALPRPCLDGFSHPFYVARCRTYAAIGTQCHCTK